MSEVDSGYRWFGIYHDSYRTKDSANNADVLQLTQIFFIGLSLRIDVEHYKISNGDMHPHLTTEIWHIELSIYSG